jgi:hypothetical protein
MVTEINESPIYAPLPEIIGRSRKVIAVAINTDINNATWNFKLCAPTSSQTPIVGYYIVSGHRA